MSQVTQSFPFVPQNEEQAKSVQDRRDAQVQLMKDGKSNRFIPVRLVELYAADWRERFGPLKKINVLRHRLGVAGNKVQVECRIVDGQEYFDYDSSTGQHIAWFYDDDQGYNLSILASHFYNGYMEIMDAEIRKEVETIAISMKEKAEEKPPEEVEGPLTATEIKNLSIEGIDEQIKYLEKQKELALKRAAPEPSALPETMEPQKIQKTPETSETSETPETGANTGGDLGPETEFSTRKKPGRKKKSVLLV